MKKKETTKIFIYNASSNESILVGNKQVAANLFNESRSMIVELFRYSKVARKEYNGESYILYEIDKYIPTNHIPNLKT